MEKLLKGRNFVLQKLLIAKTGLIFGFNKDGQVWVELRFAGKLTKSIELRAQDTWNSRDLAKLKRISSKYSRIQNVVLQK